MNGRCRRASEPVQCAWCTVAAGSALGRSSKPGPALQPERASPKDNSMIRKFAVALIATTMLVAPALAADAVKSSPTAPVTAATTTAAPAATAGSKDATKTEHRKTIKVAHRNGHHLMVAKSRQPASHVKTAKVTKPVKTVM